MQSIYVTTPVAIKVSFGVAQMDVLAKLNALVALVVALVASFDLFSRKDIDKLHYFWVFVGIN